MRDFDDEIRKLEEQIEKVKQDKKNARKIESNDILSKLQSGKYEVYFEDEFNDGWFDVLGFGTISGMNGNNILSSLDSFKAFGTIGTSSEPKFVQIGPVKVGIYREISVQYDPIHGGPDAGRGSELVGTRKDKVALSISPELQIRLKNQYQPLDPDDYDLGF